MKLTKILAIIDDVFKRCTFPTITEYGQKIKREIVRESVEEMEIEVDINENESKIKRQ